MQIRTKFKVWYRKHLSKWIPEYGIFSLVTCFLVNSLIYWGTQKIMGNATHYDVSIWIDSKIPFEKEWVVIYIVCYVFWLVNYIMISQEGKESWYRFVSADIMSRLICALFFVLYPTTNIRPEVIGSDLFSESVRFIYHMDPATNLFPSIHCLVSWFCFIGIRNSKKVSFGYKAFSAIFAMMVFASTQFIKQHGVIDIAGGVIIAESCFYIMNHTKIYQITERIFECFNKKIFGVTYNEQK